MSVETVTRHTHRDFYIVIGSLVLFLFYGTWQTGLATDDFVHLNNGLNHSLSEMLLPSAYVSVPLLHYTHALIYQLIGDHLWAYDLVKAVYLSFTFFCAFRFFSNFNSADRAFLGAVIFVCAPIYDGATIWLTGQYLCISLGLFLLSYTDAVKANIGRAFIYASLGSFASYGSTPLAIGLASLLVLRRQWLGAFALVIPNLVYVAYYAWTSVLLNIGTARVPSSSFDLSRYLKNYVAQLGSFIDAGIGPSAFMKLTFSLTSINFLSILVALATFSIVGYFLPAPASKSLPKYSLPVLGTGCIALLAFGIFALTGLYPQVSFSLGDRVMIYGGFFLVTVMVRFVSTRGLYVITLVAMFAFLGVTDHWRKWNGVVQQSVAQIRQNDDLRIMLKENDRLFVTGLQYSSLGPMAHIDHFASDYVIREIFSYAWPDRPSFNLATFSRRLEMSSSTSLRDIKYNVTYPIGESIFLYNAETNVLRRVNRDDIVDNIAQVPFDHRHWTQSLEPGRLRDMVLWLMPSLKYLYP